jgi:UDP-N-acetylmuramoylalanine--D-glutamate ligase
MRLFFDNYPNRKKIIGVTGTKGKGTTATLIKNIIEEEGLSVRLAGNIGIGVLNLLAPEIVAEDPWIILELSSFQLQDLKVSPHIAVVLMVTSEHLDYHRSIEEYVNAKAPIVGAQDADDLVIYNADYPSSVKIAESSKAKKIPFSTVSAAAIGDNGALALSEDNSIYFLENNDRELLGQISELQLRGYHNTQNVCAAALVAQSLGISKDIIWRVSRVFTGLEHRLKFVIQSKGIKFYDDSFATIPESTITAVNSFVEPIILFVGGNDKGANYEELGKELADLAQKKSLKAIITLGLVGNRIAAGLESAGYSGTVIKIDEPGKEAYDQGFEHLKEIAEAGDIVLLAPGSASFDMFRNYKERGDYFSNLANSF